MKLSMESMRQTATRSASGVIRELRQRRSNGVARSVLRSIETQRGSTDRRHIRQCDEYANEVLGSHRYAPWLHVYAAISGDFKQGWIPDNYYGLVVDPLKSGEVARVALVKSFTQRILRTDALPDLAYVIDGNYFDRNYAPIDKTELLDRLFERDEHVYFKADNSYQGRSVSIMRRTDFQATSLPALPDGVFQAPIHQHAFFNELSPRSTATIRITTARERDARIAVRAAYMRVGRAGDDIVQSKSHVRIPIDHGSGELGELGYLPNWHRVDHHPDTGFHFAGRTVPKLAEAIALCRSLHASCPHMLCLGWDVCIDRDHQVRIMEWNARYNDIKFSEATTGPCFQGLGWESLWRQAA